MHAIKNTVWHNIKRYIIDPISWDSRNCKMINDKTSIYLSWILHNQSITPINKRKENQNLKLILCHALYIKKQKYASRKERKFL